jgi:hypothetical protein
VLLLYILCTTVHTEAHHFSLAWVICLEREQWKNTTLFCCRHNWLHPQPYSRQLTQPFSLSLSLSVLSVRKVEAMPILISRRRDGEVSSSNSWSSLLILVPRLRRYLCKCLFLLIRVLTKITFSSIPSIFTLFRERKKPSRKNLYAQFWRNEATFNFWLDLIGEFFFVNT